MSEKEKEKQDIVATEMDPIALMVQDWVKEKVLPSIEAMEDFKEGMVPGIEITLTDLEILILNCFDDIQEVMMATVRGENETLH